MNNKSITKERLVLLKDGLLRESLIIDGLRVPYQHLLPFLSSGCENLHSSGEELFPVYGGELVPDTLQQVASFMPVVELQNSMIS